MCDKIHYNSKANAKINAKRLKSKGLAIQQPYMCDKCDNWHLTSHLSMNYKRKARRQRRDITMILRTM